jgi:hypothetical protein
MMNRPCSGFHAPDYRYMNRDLPLIGDSCDRSPRKSGSHQTHRWREWIRTCMGLFLSSGCFGLCADSFLFGAGKAVFRLVACDQVYRWNP